MVGKKGKFSKSPGYIRKIPPGPDLALMCYERGWSNITPSLGYDIWPTSRTRAGLNPPLPKGEAVGTLLLRSYEKRNRKIISKELLNIFEYI